jgi:hypothetical protein
MLIASFLSWFARPRMFSWSPELDLRDSHILSALIPHAHS